MDLHNGAVTDPAYGFRGHVGGLRLDDPGGKAFAESHSKVVDPSESFTIAGWVRNLGRPQQPATVFSQAGANVNAFDLRYVPGKEDPDQTGSWQIEMHNADKADDAALTASHSTFSEYDWVHIAVVYDGLRDRVSLYVNGQLDETSLGVSQEDQVLGFDTKDASLQVGRNKLGAADGSEFWPDAIDDVWAYQGALTQEQIGQLAGGQELDTENGP
ncbi:LamG domain-containing protein [Actinomadura physcomitrii]